MLNEALLLGSLSTGASAGVREENRVQREALGLYRQSELQGKICRLWSAVMGRPRRLASLDAAIGRPGINIHYHGLCAVALSQIRGSESRARDFDVDFHPLRFEDRGRWLAVATAWLAGVSLPPVELIQRGDVYYVRDGHHRISVARAMGQSYIDAQVTVWG